MDEKNTGQCGTNAAGCGFNYCFWAKVLVAIPAIPLIGIIAASFFKNPAWQFTAASFSGAITVWLADKIDRLPYLSKKFTRK